MYRVELKVGKEDTLIKFGLSEVPNVPCGVERSKKDMEGKERERFLMYRVELKGLFKVHKKGFVGEGS